MTNDVDTPVTQGELTPLAAQIAALTIRHAATTAAGFLVAIGGLQTDQTAQFVGMASGAGIALVSYAWSIYQKYSAKQAAS